MPLMGAFDFDNAAAADCPVVLDFCVREVDLPRLLLIADDDDDAADDGF
jgi:hypothetical protein